MKFLIVNMLQAYNILGSVFVFEPSNDLNADVLLQSFLNLY